MNDEPGQSTQGPATETGGLPSARIFQPQNCTGLDGQVSIWLVAEAEQRIPGSDLRLLVLVERGDAQSCGASQNVRAGSGQAGKQPGSHLKQLY